LIEHVAAQADPTQTYTLFLPSEYDAAKRYPVLLILDPRGRSLTAAQVFREGAEQYDWILLSSNDTRSDVLGENPNPRAMNALLADALARYASDEQRVYLAGFSGTAMLAWSVANVTGRIAGVIGVAGRNIPELPPAKFLFAHYGFAGDRDFNNREMREVEALMAGSSQMHRFEEFDGDHRWLPAERASDALAWMEVVAMKNGTRVRNDTFLADRFARDLHAASAFEATDPLAALRRYRAIAQTYDGLQSLDALAAAIARLSKDRAVVRAEKEEATWDAFEVRYLTDTLPNVRMLIRDASVSEGLRFLELDRRAKRPGAEGKTARRLIEAVSVQLGYYLPEEYLAKGRYDEAVTSLLGALHFHEERWPLWYNLAAAQARRGNRRHAFDALTKAVAHGFHDAAHLATDADFESLRQDGKFAAIVKSIE
jgi:predicted esterase